MSTFTTLVERLMTPSPTIFIVGLIVILLVPVLIHLVVVRTTPYSTSLPEILLVGPSLAGKTTLLTRLERGSGSGSSDGGGAASTHTSQVPVSVELTTSSSADHAGPDATAAPGDESSARFLLVDTPGHGKLRQAALERLSAPALARARTRAVVFVVDSATLTEHDTLSAAATFLYEVLLALQRRSTTVGGSGASKTVTTAIKPVPVLVAANKLDLFAALPAALVRANLEAELGRIRASRSKGLLDSGVGVDEVGSEERDDWLGSYGSEKFGFGQLAEFDVEVDVIGGNVIGEGPGIEKWWKWIVDKI